MSMNVISLSRHQQQRTTKIGALLQGFATQRRSEDDVYWLKENAEVLNILECTGTKVSAQELDPYARFYDILPDRISFFPQYYRFFLSLALDLEALGMAGEHAEQICNFVTVHELHKAELSDLQRAVAMRLLSRRGYSIEGSVALRERLHDFIHHPQSFALPNRKAAYELTHIVFYLSEYGRCDPKVSPKAVQSLIFTGVLAFLEQNADLLAEVCVALRYAGQTPPEAWEAWIKTQTNAFQIVAQGQSAADQYHEYLVSNWACSEMGAQAFNKDYATSETAFYSAVQPLGALGEISQVLLEWSGPRSASWDLMAQKVFAALPDTVASHLFDVVNSTSEFPAFFQYFARANANQERLHLPKRLERIK